MTLDLLDPGSNASKGSLDCCNWEEYIVIEKLSPGEGIGYLADMDLCTVGMNNGVELKQLTEVVNSMGEAVPLMEGEMEAIAKLDLDHRALGTTPITQGLDPDCKTSEGGTLIQELDPDGGCGGLQKVRLSKGLLDPELNAMKVNCMVIVLMI